MFAFEGLAPIDGWVMLAIAAKAAGYAAALLGMGGVIFLAVFDGEMSAFRPSGQLDRFVRRLTIASAALLLAVLAIRFGIRASRLAGTGWAGFVDTTMLGFVWKSPLGSAAVLRGIGAVLVLFVGLRTKIGLSIALAGAVSIALSYTMVGHSLGEPRILLAALLTVHLLAAAYWVGSLLPLARAAGMDRGAAILHRFGTIASGVVALLVVMGVGLAWLLGALLGTAYGWTLLLKVALVGGLLGLAALNRWRLVPALAEGRPSAGPALRRSIALEAAGVVLILLATATLTSATTPPVNM